MDNAPAVVVHATSFVVVVEPAQLVAQVLVEGRQGLPGPPGVGAAQISQAPDNRLELKPDGLYVRDDLTPDPLAYYILAKG